MPATYPAPLARPLATMPVSELTAAIDAWDALLAQSESERATVAAQGARPDATGVDPYDLAPATVVGFAEWAQRQWVTRHGAVRMDWHFRAREAVSFLQNLRLAGHLPADYTGRDRRTRAIVAAFAEAPITVSAEGDGDVADPLSLRVEVDPFALGLCIDAHLAALGGDAPFGAR